MRYVLLIFLLFCLLSSCLKPENKYVNGIIRDFGRIDEDGCGWVIEIGTQMHKPTFLDPDFETDNLAVKLKYKNTSRRALCGINSDTFDQIEIIDIKLD